MQKPLGNDRENVRKSTSKEATQVARTMFTMVNMIVFTIVNTVVTMVNTMAAAANMPSHSHHGHVNTGRPRCAAHTCAPRRSVAQPRGGWPSWSTAAMMSASTQVSSLVYQCTVNSTAR